MDKEDALALLDVMRMQLVYEPPKLDPARLAAGFSSVVSSDEYGSKSDRQISSRNDPSSG